MGREPACVLQSAADYPPLVFLARVSRRRSASLREADRARVQEVVRCGTFA